MPSAAPMPLEARLRAAEALVDTLGRNTQARVAAQAACFQGAMAGRARLHSAISQERTLAQAHALLVAVGDSQRQLVRQRLEKLVTLALRAVFEKPIVFRLEMDPARGGLGAKPAVGYPKKMPPFPVGAKQEYDWFGMDAVGGGVVDVVAFAFRVSLLGLYRPRLRQVLVADEPFKHVSDTYLPNVARMASELSKSLGLQLILVSHEEELAGAADLVIDVSHDGSSSKAVARKAGP